MCAYELTYRIGAETGVVSVGHLVVEVEWGWGNRSTPICSCGFGLDGVPAVK